MNDSNDMAAKTLAMLFFERCKNNQTIWDLVTCYSCIRLAGPIPIRGDFVSFLNVVINHVNDVKGSDGAAQCTAFFFRTLCGRDEVIHEILRLYERRVGDGFENARGSGWMFIEFLKLIVDKLPLEEH